MLQHYVATGGPVQGLRRCFLPFCRVANAEFAEIFLWITGSAYAVVHDGDAVLSSTIFQRQGLVTLGNLIHLSDTYCASAKVFGYVGSTLNGPLQPATECRTPQDVQAFGASPS